MTSEKNVIDAVRGTIAAMFNNVYHLFKDADNCTLMSQYFKLRTRGNVHIRLWRWRKRQRVLRLFRFFTVSTICFLCYCSVFSAVVALNESSGQSRNGSSKLKNTLPSSTSINDTTQMGLQFPSSDIVAQFSLPALAPGGSTTEGGSDGLASSTMTSTLNTLNRSNPTILSGSQYKNYFTHLAYDPKRKVFYAGATNKILQLNENLRVLSQALTGPKYDSPQCHASGCPDDVDTTLVNNHNKILIVNYAQGVGILIVCGSVRQGACEMYNLTNFPNSPQFIETPLAANDEFASTFAFVGPAKYSWKDEDILYVGTTFTNVGDYRHDVPAISSRRLDDLNYVEFSIQQSIINIDVKYRDHFLVNYVYGFNSSEYAYFALVQKKSHLADEAGYVTRLARICVADPNYDTYTEVTIQCLATRDNVDYNILRDAKITQAGQKLAQKMGLKRDDSVLVAVFSPSKEITDQVEAKSAMCIYSLKDIEEMFNENIHMCFNGTIKDRNLGYISGTIDDGHCPVAGTIGNIQDFCTVGLKISGSSPITTQSLFHFENVSITSVTATTTGLHTLAFLGTEFGTIKKVLISGHNAGEYEEITVDPGNRILQDTMMSSNKEFLYVLSKRKITKLRIEHCSVYSNCSSCLESRDPFCGWCSLEKRCTVRSTCQKDTSAARWLSLGSGQQCIDFESVVPDKIPITELTQVQLVIRTLPEPFNAKYRCVFGNSTPIDADVLENGLACITPPIEERPQISSNMDHVLVPLSVRSSETNKDFVSRSFAFFDCSRHNTCQNCVRSIWGCNWCIFDNKCVHKMEECRNMENVISNEEVCPHLKPSRQPILLPVQVPKEIRLEIENLPKPKSAHSGFLCTVQIETSQMLLPARIESNKIVVCEKTPYFYERNTHEYEAKVDIIWNRQHYVDTATIILYKCDVLGSHREHADCSLCVTRDPKYQCSWCGNSCVYNETCSSEVHAVGSYDMPYSMIRANECPRPRIDMIKPLSGPIEGGTLITIEGSNLGIREEDVRGKISIGKVPCELVNYEISVKIECRTGAVAHELSAPIKVANDAGYTESSVQFHFKNIQLNGLQPTIGPKSGGTQISLMGKYLNIGSHIRAFLDEYECNINVTQASSSRLTCITSEATQPEPIRILRLVIDGANRTYTCSNPMFPQIHSHKNSYSQHQVSPEQGTNYAYHYHIPSPRICSIFNYTQDPRIMQIKPLRSFASGGRVLTVHGLHLNSIQKPELEVTIDNGRINKSACTVINPNQMECPSPSVNAKFLEYKASLEQIKIAATNPYTSSFSKFRFDGVRKRSTQVEDNSYSYTTITNSANGYSGVAGADVAAFVKIRETQLNLQVGFIMDNVQWVRDLSKYFQNIRSTIVYVPDPKYTPFPGGVKLYKGDTLVIEGEQLNLAADEYDVNVTIGTSQCNITSLALNQLVCIPPEKQPAPTDENDVEQVNSLPLVVVKVGRNLRFVIGHLKYDLLKPYSFSNALVGIVVTVLIALVALFVVLIIYRRKSTQAEREYKRIQIQMITLESNVRSECKQAFAELQTDMTDLTADLESSGIPTLDHVNYIMKVFFPGVSDHPILVAPKLRLNTPHTPYDTAMLQFEQLISNKYFVLTFIETLESQKTFNIRDKVNVASLLMIVLMNKMEYATEILKCLLLRLVDKSVVGKHPHLMLRRTESVVEKMLTNYMAICMYDYLKEYAGSSLFLLFKAIKHQIGKGLVDAVTHEARYSLSEERLLHEQIPHSVVVLHIVQDDLDEKVQCKVLDWDTISQVKSKILDALFKNTPFSCRPSVHEVDLEWRHGRGGHLTLQDEDLTTKTINGWKRLNTLAHYGVKESAVMSLIARQGDGYNMHYSKQQPPYHNFYYINNSQSHIIINNDIESGLQQPRVYHLVKAVVPDHYMNIKNAVISGSNVTTSACSATSERVNKTIPEVYLTRLLAAKGTIQKFVDDFFATILTVNEELPPAVKWLFDLLDEAARRNEVADMEILHAWKSNSLPLRFWVNFIKNPDFIFDINKTVTLDSCLSVIAQTFMDACSTSEHRLGKDSPSNKLLFAKDIPQYRKMVKQFYREVARLPQISDQEMNTAMQQLSVQQSDEFDTIAALKELYIYVTKYRDEIMHALDTDVNCKKMHLSHKLENVAFTLGGEETSAC
ncbi:PREDICTED: plexin-B [Rhagoletis zephyria]|uniref:plexin-B n=1 Tax=Rhagoletis zephyria TaxID=28612 RepID=UPI0008118DD1|nr:PREDICTED: plexin-B [Rhagoletis zephyria]XP_017468490.1 PREDICTED: plexin-B [Rhagoletis zephyria]XP_036335217.1 plexin-B [Rhagoletis pomonella]XP_036335218.1 plexin-B [Rhagoletis pomonella]